MSTENRLNPEDLNSWRLSVRSALQAGRFTIKGLARAAGVPESSLRYWLSERSTGPHLAARNAIRDVLGNGNGNGSSK